MNPLIVVGSGLAGYTLIREFRKLDAQTPITLITADDGNVYSKPMLSNALTSGKDPASLVSASAEKAAVDLNITLLKHTEVLSIDPSAHQLQTRQGTLAYRSLVLALGAKPIRPPLDGDAADHVLSVNDLADYDKFRTQLKPGQQVAIIGTGLIGCEFANDLANAGYAPTVIGPSEYPMQPLIPAQAGLELKQALEGIGVQWQLGVTVTAANTDHGRIRLGLSDGRELIVDTVLSAVGLRARTDLAKSAGIAVNRGIVTDALLKTNQPDIYALGDCAEIEGRVMLYVMPLMQSARALAKTLAGEATAVRFPLMPVAIKTPAYPIIVQPAAPGVEAQWVAMESDNGLQLWQMSPEGKMLGFALTGAKTRQRGAMLAKMEQS